MEIRPTERNKGGLNVCLTGVRKDSATNLALAFSYSYVSTRGQLGGDVQYKHTNSFISEISLSTSSMNSIMKSTSLCFNSSSAWKLVIKKEMS